MCTNFLWGKSVQENHEPVQRGNKAKREENRGRKTEHLPQFGVVNEVRSMSVDESTQSQAILPAEPGNERKHQRQDGRLGGGEMKWQEFK